MKQIVQSLRTGDTKLVEIPCPQAGDGEVLIATTASLISAGTERMLVEFGKSSWIDRARQQPDKVRMVLDKVRTDGLMSALEAVQSKLDQPLPMGYCNSGTVMGVGKGVEGFSVGDRVVSNGRHSEFVAVPMNLCARVPDSVPDETAVFTPLAAIVLQGVRLAAPSLGEVFVVSGLGLLGLLAVQLLRANGCMVIGADFDSRRVDLARAYGAVAVNLSDAGALEQAARVETQGRGVDGVLVCAATDSNDPMHQAAAISRKRGRIVLVGVTGLELSRADFYEKELSFQVSCSYGPGRHDPAYEQKGQDYPIGFVRWTAQRNFEAVLNLMSAGALDVSSLVSHRFAQERAAEAYTILTGDAPSLGILLEYPEANRKAPAEATIRTSAAAAQSAPSGAAVVGFIGAGNHGQRVLMPAFKAAGARLKTVASAGGLSAADSATKFGFEHASTDVDALLSDPEINTIVIATRHADHADLASRALAAGKHVYVEKPLALTRGQLSTLRQAWDASRAASNPPLLMAGYNRRFAPHIRKAKSLLYPMRGPKVFVMTVNAGAIPDNHWTRDPEEGGGRIVGEACHFIDLLRHLAASPISRTFVAALGDDPAGRRDSISLGLEFADGSLGTVHYLANGHRSFSKERLEIFAGGRILQLTNFRRLTGYGWPGFSGMNLWRQDKGGPACVASFVEAARTGGASPISAEELFEVAALTIEIAERAQGTSAPVHDGA